MTAQGFSGSLTRWLGDSTNFCSTASPTGRVGRKRGSARSARRSADDTVCAGAVLATKRRMEESTSSISAPSLSSLIPSPQMPSALRSCCRSHLHRRAEHFDHSKIVNYLCIYLIIYSARKSNSNVKNSADAAAATRDTAGRMQDQWPRYEKPAPWGGFHRAWSRLGRLGLLTP